MSMMGNGGPSVLQEGATEEKGEHARLSSFVGAMAIADLVKSTLGPKGMEAEAQQQKGSAAYAKRLKSPWFFQALVPPEDRDTYDKGYSLLPGA